MNRPPGDAAAGGAPAPATRRCLVALAVVIAAATGLRVWNVSSSPATFHPTRQYAGLALAKAWYDDLSGDLPADDRTAVQANARTVPRLEPRLLEAVVAVSYVVLGGERPWVAGFLSSLFWAAGGVFLFLLARRLASDLAAWVSLCFHLFVPFGVLASRTFQPDPAMVTFLLAAVLAMVRSVEAPTARRLVAAGALAGVALLLKPVCVFVLAGAFAAIVTGTARSWRALVSRSTLVVGVVATLPAVAFYVFESVTRPAVGSFAGSTFLPRLWLDGAYWRGWLRMVNATVGLAMLALALVSLAVSRHRRARRLVAGMLAGYAVYGLVFNYHIHTHNYYQLQLIPIVALGLGLTADAAAVRFRTVEMRGMVRRAMAAGLVLLAVALAVSDVRLARATIGPDARRQLAQAPAIGDVVGHSTRTVALAPAYGLTLFHEGNLSGAPWPNQADFRFQSLQGLKRRTAAEELDGLDPDWFIVTDFPEFAAQPELRALLEERGRLVADEDGYLVYDLRDRPPLP